LGSKIIKKKILFFANSSFIGGAETNILAIAASLKYRYEVVVAALEPGGPLLDKAKSQGIKTFQPAFQSYYNPKFLFSILGFLCKNKIDIIYIFGFKLRAFLLPLSWICRIPVRISAIRGLDAWKNSLHILVERLLAFFTSIWVANSMYAKNHYCNIQKIEPNRIYVIYNGFPIPNTPKRRDRKPTRLIGIIANLSENKGHKLFLSALKAIDTFQQNIEVEFIGKDFSRGIIPGYIKNFGMENCVKYVGYKDNIPKYIEKFDFIMLPSHSESLPSSIIEAMLAEKVVIASNVGGVPEMIQHQVTGFLFEKGNKLDLVDKLAYALANPKECAKISQNAFEYAIVNFSIERVKNEYTKLFENLLVKLH
jgi:glycosyltransferase involved in cell wall biosynthesis